MYNFISTFEKLDKLYEEVQTPKAASKKPVEDVEEGVLGTALAAGAGCLVGSAIGNALSEDAEAIEDSAEEAPVEEDTVIEETEAEAEPRQIICECDKCGALVIKTEADIAIDEASDLVNIEDECQFCDEANGYRIVGVVAPYEITEDAELEELFDVKLDARGFGGSGNNVSVLGGKLPESLDEEEPEEVSEEKSVK